MLFRSAGGHYLVAAPGYASYVWNTGDTGRIIPVATADSFYVFVPYGGNGGYISSEKFIVTNAADPCGLGTSVTTLFSNNNINVFPNPAGNRLTVQSETAVFYGLEIYNPVGEKVLTTPLKTDPDFRQTDIDIHSLSPGIYFLRMFSPEKVVTGKFVKN